MKLRTFTVPFSKIVGEDAAELEFGPDDYMVVRPLFALPREEASAFAQRVNEVEAQAVAARDLEAKDRKRKEAEDAADALILDTIRLACLEWSLTGTDGQPIPMPQTPEALNALPMGLVNRLFPFLQTYRGEGPNPTTPR